MAGRKKDGKPENNHYAVINLDEPYAKEVVEIMKRHGHWEEPVPAKYLDLSFTKTYKL